MDDFNVFHDQVVFEKRSKQNNEPNHPNHPEQQNGYVMADQSFMAGSKTRNSPAS